MTSAPELTGDPALDRQLADLVAGLDRKFHGDVPRQELERVAGECLRSFWDEARIRDFIPLLAERCAIDKIHRAQRR